MRFTRFRFWIVLVCMSLLMISCSSPAASDDETDSYTIAILAGPPVFQSVIDGFKEGMAEAGYVEGENTTYLFIEGFESPGDYSQQARTHAEEDIDAFFAVSHPAVLAAIDETDGIPIVAALLVNGSPADAYVDSLERPGGPFTGIYDGPVTVRRLELLAEMFPEVEQVYIPLDRLQGNASGSEVPALLAELEPIADELGVELVTEFVDAPDEVAEAAANIPEDVDAIFTLPGPNEQESQIWGAEAIERGIPYSNVARGNEEGGPTVSFGPDFFANGKLAADQMVLVLEGAEVGEIPMQTGEFYLVINLQTADTANVEIGDEFLNRANEVITVE